jgi:ubiquinone/menaquinone biosynthesis C-methylase UbiE
MPKDAAEGDRLEAQNHLFKLAAGGLYRAPVRQPRAILDVACGTGIWAREMALAFPRAQVIGIDIDPSLPERASEILGPSGQFPHNFRFQVADALQPLPFEDEAFDFVHARLISPFVPIKVWPQVVQEMARVLRRGGMLEVVDGEHVPQSPSTSFRQIFQFPQALLEKRGLHVGMGDALRDYFQQAGIQRIQQRKFTLGQGKSTSGTVRQQRLLAADLLAAMANFKPLAVHQFGIAEGEFDRLCQQAKEEVPRLGIHWPVVFCFGTKL